MVYWEPKIVKMYRIVFLLLSSLFFFGCQTSEKELRLPYYNSPEFTPLFIDNSDEVSKQITHTIRDFQFLNQDSVLVNQKMIEGKIHVANFIFTTCGSICPVMTQNLKIVYDSLKNNQDLVLMSYSVTPWIDRPHVLRQYKINHEIEGNRWLFLTGSKGDIYSLARQSYFAEEDLGFTKDSMEFLHTEHVLLVDKHKRIRGIYNGTLSLEMLQLIKDIRNLEKEED